MLCPTAALAVVLPRSCTVTEARVPFGRVVRIDGLLSGLMDFEEAYDMLLTDQRTMVPEDDDLRKLQQASGHEHGYPRPARLASAVVSQPIAGSFAGVQDSGGQAHPSSYCATSNSLQWIDPESGLFYFVHALQSDGAVVNEKLNLYEAGTFIERHQV